MTADPGILYRSCRERIMALVSGPGVDPALVVPATPAWTIHDVIAHVAGVANDARNGNMAGAPGEAWTAAQIERGRGRSVADLLAEWDDDGAILDGVFSGANGGMLSAGIFDVHSHEADLRQALGLPLVVPEDFLGWGGPQLRDSFVERVVERGLPAVSLDLPFVEWFRGRLGRRSVAEVCAYPWPTDPAPYLDSFFIFGRAAASLHEVA
jgi:uncharacterized protein (TIGR03083 family)